MSALSGWCSPGPIGSHPNHAGCRFAPCACTCHQTSPDGVNAERTRGSALIGREGRQPSATSPNIGHASRPAFQGDGRTCAGRASDTGALIYKGILLESDTKRGPVRANESDPLATVSTTPKGA